MVKNKQIGIRVDDKMKEILEAYAKQDGRTLSNLILKILDDWVKEKEAATVEPSERQKKGA